MSRSLPELLVYSRPGCHLCEVLIDELMPIVRDRVRIVVRNIDASEELEERYGDRIPVVEFGGKCVSQFTLDRDSVLTAISTDKNGIC